MLRVGNCRGSVGSEKSRPCKRGGLQMLANPELLLGLDFFRMALRPWRGRKFVSLEKRLECLEKRSESMREKAAE
jgi:hypothetical protein